MFGTIFGLITGLLGFVGGSIYSLLSSALPMVMKYHNSSIAYARNVGMSLQQSRAYSHMLVEDASNLASKYGLTDEQVIHLQEHLSEATGKQAMLTEAQREQLVQINKLMGEDFSRRIEQTLVRDMGASLDAIGKISTNVYATAIKHGLNASSYSKRFLDNMSLANKLTFQNGLRGVAEMTALSEKFNFNLQSIEGVASKVRNISDAITMSAQLQSLGGSAAVYGSNPLAWMFESQSDAEGLTQRIIDMTSGMAHFDRKTGTATWNGGYARELAMEYANAMSMSFDEFTKIAMSKANVEYKEANFKPILDRLAGNDNAKRDFFLNKMQVDENNKAYMVDSGGRKRDMSYYETPEGTKELEKMMFYEGQSNEELMKNMALELTTIHEQIQGFETSIIARIASKLDQYLPGIHDKIREYAPKIADWIIKGIDYVGDKLPSPETIGKWIKEVVRHVHNAWQIARNIYQGVNKLLPVVGILTSILAVAAAGRFINGIGVGGRNIGGVLNRSSRLTAGRGMGLGARALRGLGWGAVGLGIDLASNAFIDETKHPTLKKAANIASNAATGAAIGSMLGPVGTATGAIVGGLYGAAKQFWWNNKESEQAHSLTKQSSGGGGGVRYAGGGVVGTDIVGRVNSGEMILNPVQQSNLYNFINAGSSGGTRGYSDGGVVGGNSTTGDRIILIGSDRRTGSGGISPVQQSRLFNFINGQTSLSVQPPSVTPPSVNLSTVTGDRISNMIGGAARIENSSIVSRETNRSIVAAPVGGRAEIYRPQSESTQQNVSVNDFNVNISGTIRIDGGIGGSSPVGVSASDLLADESFVRQLKDIIKNSIASDMFSGRRMNDDAVNRGVTNAVTSFGR